MINAKQAARLRHKLKTSGRLHAKGQASLDEYDAMRAGKAQTAAPGEPKPGEVPVADPGREDPPPPPNGEPIPGVEPPPPVAPPPPSSESRSSGGKVGDWRDKWRGQIHYSGDGRQMLCEGIGMSLVEGLAALRDETAKVATPRTPDPRALAGMFVLAMDDLLPERARMTPKVGAALLAAGTIVERYYYAEQIKEFLKTDPEHIAWAKKQAERERTEQEHRAAHNAEAAGAEAPPPPPAQYADPTPPPGAPAPNGTAIMVAPAQKPRMTSEELERDGWF